MNMSKIVVYESGTGFTAKYAAWIAEELGCEAKELRKINIKELNQYDMVIYGGWIMAGMVAGYGKIKELNLKKLVVFAVGMTIPSEEVKTKIQEQNQIPESDFFYFEGGYNPKKLGFFKKMMMNMIGKSIEKKEEKTEEDLYMLETLKGADRTNKDAIRELVEFCKM